MSDTKPKTKAQMARAIEARTDIRSQDVNEVLDALAEVVLDDLSVGGPGSVTVAGLIKVDVVGQTARPERQGRQPGDR